MTSNPYNINPMIFNLRMNQPRITFVETKILFYQIKTITNHQSK